MYNRGKWIPDQQTSTVLYGAMHRVICKENTDCSTEYEAQYRTWITNTRNNTVRGLELFPNAVFSHGTTESFDKFYTRHRNRTVRVLAGEYAYHQYAVNCQVGGIDDVTADDCVVVSLPFADSGTQYLYRELMQRCTELGVPVLVDCCWFGMCSGIDFDFTYPCIEDVVFSLSKTFPVNKLRIGCRFSKPYCDGLTVYREHEYTNFYLQHIAMDLLAQFTSDYMFNKYHLKQLKLCKQLQVTPSPVVNLAWGSGENWTYLNRGGPFNRLCLSDGFSKV
jgi:hypothetical protein